MKAIGVFESLCKTFCPKVSGIKFSITWIHLEKVFKIKFHGQRNSLVGKILTLHTEDMSLNTKPQNVHQSPTRSEF